MCTNERGREEGNWWWYSGWIEVGVVGGGWGVGSVEKFRNEYPCKYARIVSAANCSVFCRGSANNRFAFQR